MMSKRKGPLLKQRKLNLSPILQLAPMTVFVMNVPVPIDEFLPITTSSSSVQSLFNKN